MEIIDNSSDSEAIAKLLDNNNGVYFVPAFTGLGAPYWDANARGTICGIGRGTNKAHIIRAALEASAYQTYDLLEAIKKDGIDLKVLRIDGGMSANNFFCQFLADICNIKAVSYTHLDVYKRQQARLGANIKNNDKKIRFLKGMKIVFVKLYLQSIFLFKKSQSK